MNDDVYAPAHYTGKKTETIDAIRAITDGLPGYQGYILGNILKYMDRRDDKDSCEIDLAKANNYAHLLVTGHWKPASTSQTVTISGPIDCLPKVAALVAGVDQ